MAKERKHYWFETKDWEKLIKNRGRMTKKKLRFTLLDAVLITLILAAVVLPFTASGWRWIPWQWPVILQYLVASRDTWALGTLMQGLLTTVKLSLWAMVLATLLGTSWGGSG